MFDSQLKIKKQLCILILLSLIAFCSIPFDSAAQNETYGQALVNAKTNADAPTIGQNIPGHMDLATLHF